MIKRFLACLFALVLLVSTTVAYAANDTEYSFTALIANELDCLASTESAADSKEMAAASLMFELVLHQSMNDMDIEVGALNNDCLLGTKDGMVSMVYDLGDGELLLLVYDTSNADIYAGYLDASMTAGRLGLENEGYVVYDVSGTAWTTLFNLILDTLANGD